MALRATLAHTRSVARKLLGLEGLRAPVQNIVPAAMKRAALEVATGRLPCRGRTHRISSAGRCLRRVRGARRTSDGATRMCTWPSAETYVCVSTTRYAVAASRAFASRFTRERRAACAPSSADRFRPERRSRSRSAALCVLGEHAAPCLFCELLVVAVAQPVLAHQLPVPEGWRRIGRLSCCSRAA